MSEWHSNELVDEFKQGRVHIFVYTAREGSYVAADQAGYLEGSWSSAAEAMAAAKAANGL